METTKLSSKGQVIIPKSLRDRYQWQVGQEFIVVNTGEGILLKVKKPFDLTSLDEVAGSLRYEGAPKTLDEMEAAIRHGAVEQAHGDA
jgi:AbrB family looped-hinge helix DNA binding protein